MAGRRIKKQLKIMSDIAKIPYDKLIDGEIENLTEVKMLYHFGITFNNPDDGLSAYEKLRKKEYSIDDSNHELFTTPDGNTYREPQKHAIGWRE